MARQVWVIQSTGFPGPVERAAAGPSADGSRTTKSPKRRFGLRARGHKEAPSVPSERGRAARPTRASTQPLVFAPREHGIWAVPDGLAHVTAVGQVAAVPERQWTDTEPAWLDPAGPRRAQGVDRSWTILCGTLVGGPFRWALQHHGEQGSRWTFLSVSGRPTPGEFAQQIASIAGPDAARGLVAAIRHSLPDCISDA